MGINTKLITIDGKLDQIITLLGSIAGALGAPPEPPVHTFDELYGLVNNILTGTGNIDTKLLSIRNYIKNPEEPAIEDDYNSLLWNLYILRLSIATASLPGSTSAVKVQDALNQIYAALNPEIGNLVSYNEQIRDKLHFALTNLGLSVDSSTFDYTNNSYLFKTLNFAALLSGSLGLPVEAGNRTVIKLLSLMLDRPTTGEITGGLYPPDLCSGAYMSDGMRIAPLDITGILSSTLWASFPIPPPVGLEFGSTFNLGLDSDTTELVNTFGDWDNWRFYVASSNDNFGIYVGTNVDLSLRRYPTNTWVTFPDLNEHLSFYVPGEASIRVFMCEGAGSGSSSGGPWGGGSSGGGSWEPQCYEGSSSLVDVNPSYGYSPRQMVYFDDLTLIDSISWSGGSTTTTPAAIHSGNYTGWVVTSTSGRVRVTYGVDGGAIHWIALDDTGDTWTVPSGYNYVIFDDATGTANEPGTGAFGVEFCSP